jgi:hypothetical protein
MARFRSGTRYSNGTFTLNKENKSFMILRELLSIPEADDDAYLTIEGGFEKRPDLISNQMYGRPDLGWAIMDINGIKDPFIELMTGTVLRIPNLSRVLDGISSINKKEM